MEIGQDEETAESELTELNGGNDYALALKRTRPSQRSRQALQDPLSILRLSAGPLQVDLVMQR